MGAFDDLLPKPAGGAFDDLVPDPTGGLASTAPKSDGRVVATTPGGGRVIERPDGTQMFTSPGYATSDPGQVSRILEGATPAAVAKAGPVSTDGNLIRQGFQGLTVGAGDEITAYLQSLAGGNSYETELGRERARLAEGTAEAPIASLAANVAGGVVPGGALMDGLTRGARALGAGATGLASKIGLGAVAGGAEGLAYGYNTGEGGVADRVDNAAEVGAIGAMFGAGVPAVTAVARPVLRGALNLMTQPFTKSANPTAASRLVQRSIARAETTPDDLEALLRGAAADGQPQYAIADALGASGRSTLNGAVRQPGAAKTEAVAMLTERQAGQGKRLGTAISGALGATDTAAQRTAALTKARDDAADLAFNAARANAGPVDVKGVLATIDAGLSPTRGPGIDPDSIDAGLLRFRDKLASPTAELSDFNQVFRVRKEMRDAREIALRAGAGEKAKEISAIIDAMDDALGTASPDYRAAMADYSTASRTIEAVDTGAAASVPTARSADTLAQYGALPPPAQDAYRAGYADPLLSAIESGAPGVNKARPLQSDKRVAEFSQLAADPDQLLRIIQREADMFTTGNRVLGGSATADNLADAADQANGAAHLVGEAVVNPKWALRRALGGAADYIINGATGQNEATRALLARMMLGTDVQGALEPAITSQKTLEMYDDIVGALARTTATRAGGQQ